ncbi:MscS Mechanosensitive ion channel [Candidatus Methylomirabilis oxygeniifera]|uniref:MscS Mechanosensitive ion channel n=1 Tax=Methylomirabilis oxygeniifera TaxID=671143 RepID=D5MEP9_METO1|nr:MscS Mechanosensitive ion channel [Candidatus Methylomirabilis oxyfera]
MTMSPTDLVIDLTIRYGFKVLGAMIILAAGLLVARWIGNVVHSWVSRQQIEPPVRILIVRTIRVVVILLTFVVAVDNLGIQISPFLAGLGVAGIGLGLALQGVLSNVIAGLTIIFTKPYRVGEYIDVLGEEGEVKSIDLFSTILVHPDLSKVVIPNRKIVGEILHNFGAMRQMNMKVGVAYGTDLNDTMGLVRQILEDSAYVLKEPIPLVGITMLDDSAIVISVRPWVKVDDYETAQAELYQTIVERFQDSRIAIPFPQREVRLVSEP